MKLVKNYILNIYIAIFISIIIRFLLINSYGDTKLDHEWEVLFYNLKNFGILAYKTFDGKPIPSVYMPPLYIYYIYLVDFIKPDNLNLVRTLILTQIFLSGISIFIFYKINLIFFKKKISLISAYIFSLFPLFIYSSLQVSSICIQILLNLIFLYLVLKIINQRISSKYLILLSIFSGFSILLRGEFVLIFIFTIFFLILIKKISVKKFILILVVTTLTISPYLIRNYIIFEKITITKSFGYNLWKGNNIDATVEGSESDRAFNDKNIKAKINKIEKNLNYDFNYDQIFLETALSYIHEDPTLFLSRFVKKFFAFTFFNFNSKYPNYYHFLNILPILGLSLIFFASVIFSFQKTNEYRYLFLNLLVTILIFSFFFILPRYKLIILPTQLILINFFLEKVSTKMLK